MSFDLGHWDVTDMTEASAEAYEMVEEGRITPEDFRSFAFSHAVRLYGTPNPDFFKGTIIEKEAADELARRRQLSLELGGKERVARQHTDGRLTIRDRLEALLEYSLSTAFHKDGRILGRPS